MQGDQDQAQQLLKKCLKTLPGHRGFLAFAGQIGLPSTGH